MDKRLCPLLGDNSEPQETESNGFPHLTLFPEGCPFRTSKFGRGFPKNCPYREDDFGRGFPLGCPIRNATMPEGIPPAPSPIDLFLVPKNLLVPEIVTPSVQKPEPAAKRRTVVQNAVDPFAEQNTANTSPRPTPPLQKDNSAKEEFNTGKFAMGLIATIMLCMSAAVLAFTSWEGMTAIEKAAAIFVPGLLMSLLGLNGMRRAESSDYYSVITAIGGSLMFVATFSMWAFLDLINFQTMSVSVCLIGFAFAGIYRYFRKKFIIIGMVYASCLPVISPLFAGKTSIEDFACSYVCMSLMPLAVAFALGGKDRVHNSACHHLNILLQLLYIIIASFKEGAAIQWINAVMILSVLISAGFIAAKEKNRARASTAVTIAQIATAIAYSSMISKLSMHIIIAIFLFALENLALLHIADKNKGARSSLFRILAIGSGVFSGIIFLPEKGFIAGASLFLLIAMPILKTRQSSSPYYRETKRLIAFDSIMLILLMLFFLNRISIPVVILTSVIPSLVLTCLFIDESKEWRASSLLFSIVSLSFLASATQAGGALSGHLIEPSTNRLVNLLAGALEFISTNCRLLFLTQITALVSFCLFYVAGWFADWKGDMLYVIKRLSHIFGNSGSSKVDGRFKKTSSRYFSALAVTSVFILLMGIFQQKPQALDNTDPFVYALALAFTVFSIIWCNHTANVRPGDFPVVAIFFYLFLMLLMIAYFNQPFYSPALTVAGIFIGFISTVAGFNFRRKNIRLFGLGAVIVMVAKFIFVDFFAISNINGTTPLSLAVSLALGGACALGITKLYSYFESSAKDDPSAEETEEEEPEPVEEEPSEEEEESTEEE